MKISIRELRNSLKRVLGAVQLGEEAVIYVHKHPIAKIIPIRPSDEPKICDIGFGMWSGREEFNDVEGYVRKLRKGRSHDI